MNIVIPTSILGVIQVPITNRPPKPPGPFPPNENSVYRGFGKGFWRIDVIRLPKYDNEYMGSRASWNISVVIESAILNPMNKIIKVTIIVRFIFFINELKKVTKLLSMMMYNTAKPNE